MRQEVSTVEFICCESLRRDEIISKRHSLESCDPKMTFRNRIAADTGLPKWIAQGVLYKHHEVAQYAVI